MTNLLGLKGAPGLSDVLYNNENIADMVLDYVQESELDGLDVLPSGPRRPNPAELLTGARMGELLAWADGHYDQILLDSPPVLAASDSLMLGRLVDGAIIVVRPDKNRRRAVTRAVESFRNMHVEVLGIIPNCVNNEASKGYGFEYGYGYGYNYGYGEEDHSQEEGFVDDGAHVELLPNATLRSESDDAAAGDDDDMIVPRWAA
jgi:Mrp family chromosome partitioning ATPase